MMAFADKKPDDCAGDSQTFLSGVLTSFSANYEQLHNIINQEILTLSTRNQQQDCTEALPIPIKLQTEGNSKSSSSCETFKTCQSETTPFTRSNNNNNDMRDHPYPKKRSGRRVFTSGQRNSDVSVYTSNQSKASSLTGSDYFDIMNRTEQEVEHNAPFVACTDTDPSSRCASWISNLEFRTGSDVSSFGPTECSESYSSNEQMRRETFLRADSSFLSFPSTRSSYDSNIGHKEARSKRSRKQQVHLEMECYSDDESYYTSSEANFSTVDGLRRSTSVDQLKMYMNVSFAQPVDSQKEQFRKTLRDSAVDPKEKFQDYRRKSPDKSCDGQTDVGIAVLIPKTLSPSKQPGVQVRVSSPTAVYQEDIMLTPTETVDRLGEEDNNPMDQIHCTIEVEQVDNKACQSAKTISQNSFVNEETSDMDKMFMASNTSTEGSYDGQGYNYAGARSFKEQKHSKSCADAPVPEQDDLETAMHVMHDSLHTDSTNRRSDMHESLRSESTNQRSVAYSNERTEEKYSSQNLKAFDPSKFNDLTSSLPFVVIDRDKQAAQSGDLKEFGADNQDNFVSLTSIQGDDDQQEKRVQKQISPKSPEPKNWVVPRGLHQDCITCSLCSARKKREAKRYLESKGSSSLSLNARADAIDGIDDDMTLNNAASIVTEEEKNSLCDSCRLRYSSTDTEETFSERADSERRKKSAGIHHNPVYDAVVAQFKEIFSAEREVDPYLTTSEESQTAFDSMRGRQLEADHAFERQDVREYSKHQNSAESRHQIEMSSSEQSRRSPASFHGTANNEHQMSQQREDASYQKSTIVSPSKSPIPRSRSPYGSQNPTMGKIAKGSDESQRAASPHGSHKSRHQYESQQTEYSHDFQRDVMSYESAKAEDSSESRTAGRSHEVTRTRRQYEPLKAGNLRDTPRSKSPNESENAERPHEFQRARRYKSPNSEHSREKHRSDSPFEYQEVGSSHETRRLRQAYDSRRTKRPFEAKLDGSQFESQQGGSQFESQQNGKQFESLRGESQSQSQRSRSGFESQKSYLTKERPLSPNAGHLPESQRAGSQYDSQGAGSPFMSNQASSSFQSQASVSQFDSQRATCQYEFQTDEYIHESKITASPYESQRTTSPMEGLSSDSRRNGNPYVSQRSGSPFETANAGNLYDLQRPGIALESSRSRNKTSSPRSRSPAAYQGSRRPASSQLESPRAQSPYESQRNGSSVDYPGKPAPSPRSRSSAPHTRSRSPAESTRSRSSAPATSSQATAASPRSRSPVEGTRSTSPTARQKSVSPALYKFESPRAQSPYQSQRGNSRFEAPRSRSPAQSPRSRSPTASTRSRSPTASPRSRQQASSPRSSNPVQSYFASPKAEMPYDSKKAGSTFKSQSPAEGTMSRSPAATERSESPTSSQFESLRAQSPFESQNYGTSVDYPRFKSPQSRNPAAIQGTESSASSQFEFPRVQNPNGTQQGDSRFEVPRYRSPTPSPRSINPAQSQRSRRQTPSPRSVSPTSSQFESPRSQSPYESQKYGTSVDCQQYRSPQSTKPRSPAVIQETERSASSQFEFPRVQYPNGSQQGDVQRSRSPIPSPRSITPAQSPRSRRQTQSPRAQSPYESQRCDSTFEVKRSSPATPPRYKSPVVSPRTRSPAGSLSSRSPSSSKTPAPFLLGSPIAGGQYESQRTVNEFKSSSLRSQAACSKSKSPATSLRSRSPTTSIRSKSPAATQGFITEDTVIALNEAGLHDEDQSQSCLYQKFSDSNLQMPSPNFQTFEFKNQSKVKSFGHNESLGIFQPIYPSDAVPSQNHATKDLLFDHSYHMDSRSQGLAQAEQMNYFLSSQDSMEDDQHSSRSKGSLDSGEQSTQRPIQDSDYDVKKPSSGSSGMKVSTSSGNFKEFADEKMSGSLRVIGEPVSNMLNGQGADLLSDLPTLWKTTEIFHEDLPKSERSNYKKRKGKTPHRSITGSKKSLRKCRNKSTSTHLSGLYGGIWKYKQEKCHSKWVFRHDPAARYHLDLRCLVDYGLISETQELTGTTILGRQIPGCRHDVLQYSLSERGFITELTDVQRKQQGDYQHIKEPKFETEDSLGRGLMDLSCYRQIRLFSAQPAYIQTMADKKEVATKTAFVQGTQGWFKPWVDALGANKLWHVSKKTVKGEQSRCITCKSGECKPNADMYCEQEIQQHPMSAPLPAQVSPAKMGPFQATDQYKRSWTSKYLTATNETPAAIMSSRFPKSRRSSAFFKRGNMAAYRIQQHKPPRRIESKVSVSDHTIQKSARQKRSIWKPWTLFRWGTDKNNNNTEVHAQDEAYPLVSNNAQLQRMTDSNMLSVTQVFTKARHRKWKMHNMEQMEQIDQMIYTSRPVRRRQIWSKNI